MKENEIIEHYFKKGQSGLRGMVIGLVGSLGAGKTQFVKKLLSQISVDFENLVHSPTFNLCNVYSDEEFEVHHFDVYRVESEDELYDIEIWESTENTNVLTLIEWADRFSDIKLKCDEIIEISICEDEKREYLIKVNNVRLG